MHIIFGDDQAQKLGEKYTVLELDTFKFIPSNVRAIAYAVVESIPIEDLPRLSFQIDLHNNLIKNYRLRDWNFCEQAIENLVGVFGGELDSFYADLQARIGKLKTTELTEDWDPALVRDDPRQ